MPPTEPSRPPSTSTNEIVADLARDAEDVIETHISWVIRFAADVYKIKKAVDLGFVDFSTLEKRKAACEEEVRLDSRLSIDVYHGVLPVVRHRDGRFGFGETGEPPQEWAVHMRRLPDEQRGDRLLEGDQRHRAAPNGHAPPNGESEPGRAGLSLDDVTQLARQLVSFHMSAALEPEEADHFGSPAMIEQTLRENFEPVHEIAAALVGRDRAEEIAQWQLSFLRANADLLRARVDQGKIGETHGDLRLEHIYIEDRGISVIDGIEFNERLRRTDVCADLAFLSMDLRFRGRPDLAELLLATYAQEAGDYDLYRLVDFYESYRAYVRAKVAAIRLEQAVTDETRVPFQLEERARAFFVLSLAEKKPPLEKPALYMVAGGVASGKTTIAKQISRELGAPIVSSDWTRKQIAGAAPSTNLAAPAWEGLYSQAATERTYAEIIRRARTVMNSGRSVILDASFRARWMRRLARELAMGRDAPLYVIQCSVDRDTARRRLEARRAGSGPEHVSDATVTVIDEHARLWEPIDELEPSRMLSLDTRRPLAANLERLRQTIPIRPQRPGEGRPRGDSRPS